MTTLFAISLWEAIKIGFGVYLGYIVALCSLVVLMILGSVILIAYAGDF